MEIWYQQQDFFNQQRFDRIKDWMHDNVVSIFET